MFFLTLEINIDFGRTIVVFWLYLPDAMQLHVFTNDYDLRAYIATYLKLKPCILQRQCTENLKYFINKRNKHLVLKRAN